MGAAPGSCGAAGISGAAGAGVCRRPAVRPGAGRSTLPAVRWDSACERVPGARREHAGCRGPAVRWSRGSAGLGLGATGSLRDGLSSRCGGTLRVGLGCRGGRCLRCRRGSGGGLRVGLGRNGILCAESALGCGDCAPGWVAAESTFPLSGGGIISSGSLDMIRLTTSLSAGLPGTIAFAPESSSAVAACGKSRRRPALRLAESGPWHLKQRSERIDRISWR